ncbi:complement C4-B-like [Amblyraja radiata]|uniref:complement C4-B-like n=1 Tax=Amblyraja radiata TaxID=386614 RepID=UPI00140394AC|nr:complement C4-B-like [Amblyraja radiata]
MVTHPDGTPVPKAPIKVSILISEKVSIEKSKQGFTDELGEMSISFVVPEDAREMYVTASVNDTRGNEVKSEIAIKAHQSNQLYMHIDVPNVLLYAGDIINVTLTDLGPTNSSSVEHYYYMILSKGKLLHHERIERSTHTHVQVNITQDMVPYFRMVAYYVTDVHGQSHLVSDSVRVEVEESCDLQMQIMPNLVMEDSRSYLLLNIFTHRSADVHVQAVDNKLAKAHVDLGIYEQAFYRKDLYDFGISYGGGRNAAAVFEDAGLRYLSDLLPLSELSEVTSVPWHRSQLQTSRYDLEVQHPFPTVQPLYRKSWMWEIQNTTGTKTFRLTSTISPPKVWEISAFSVSENKELCIFRPLLMKINED